MRIIGIIVLSVLLYSCSEPPYYEEMKTINGEWSSNDPAVFTFKIEDTSEQFELLMDLRHTEAYAFSNLYVFMELHFPNGKKSVDTLECFLADQRGKWGGRSTGDLVDHRIRLRNQPAVFPLEGEYTVTITQAMRVDPLPEIMDVGFALEYWPSGE